MAALDLPEGTPVDRVCQYCGKNFVWKFRRVKMPQRFCSQTCSKRGTRWGYETLPPSERDTRVGGKW